MAGAADVTLTFDDCLDDLTDEGFDQGDYVSPDGSSTGGTSLASLLGGQKSVQNGELLERPYLPDVQNIFRTVPPDVLTQRLPDIMKAFVKFVDNTHFKGDVLDIIPNVAARAVENTPRVEALRDVIGDYLIPLVLKHLGSSDTVLDKKAQDVLVQLLQRGFVSQFQAEVKICPSVLALTKMEGQVDILPSAVRLMSRVAPLLGKDITERILLKRFAELCASPLFHVRKQASYYIGYFCPVIGMSAFEKTLLPCYLALCQDEIWGVRKSCAQVAMYVSVVCPPELRKTLLASAFLKLLKDECRWVWISAQQYLGAFITTFADPPLASIEFNAHGEVVFVNRDGIEFHPEDVEGFSVTDDEIKRNEFYLYVNMKGPSTDLDDCPPDNISSDENLGNSVEVESTPLPENDTPPPQKHEDDLLSYNEYNYWYINPPEVQVEDLLDVCDAYLDDDSNVSSEDIVTNHLEELYAGISLNSTLDSEPTPQSIQPSSDTQSDNVDLKNSNVADSNVNNREETTEVKPEPPQHIVPQEFIDIFVSMSQVNFSLSKPDMAGDCAYSFPAVLLTLGKDNWPLLKGVMNDLLGHAAYTIRRTVAKSFHEVAIILGSELASEDLCPIFEGFLKDIEEVQEGVLNHLFQFMQIIKPEKRAILLPKLVEFLEVDSIRKWRLKETFAQQLTLCVPLFSPADVSKYIGWYAQALMISTVAAVRTAATILATEVIKHIAKDRSMTSTYLSVISERFAHSKKWKCHQTFAVLCIETLKRDALEADDFAMMLLPQLLDLSWDPISNVRVVVANCIVNYVMKIDYFTDPENKHIESLNNVLRRLQADKDRDVRMFASGVC